MWKSIKEWLEKYCVVNQEDCNDIRLSTMENGRPVSPIFVREKTLAKLKQAYYNWNRRGIEEKIWKLNDEGIVFSSNNQYINDIIFLCLVYVKINKNIYEIIEQSSAELQQILLHLVTKYRITRLSDNYECLPSNIITLERIAKCYPNICCNFFAEGKATLRIVEENILGEEIRGHRKVIFCPLFPLVASNLLLQKNTNILPQLLWISYKIEEELYPTYFHNIVKLWYKLKNSIISSSIPEIDKLDYCKQWKIININGQPIRLFEKSRSYCLLKLNKRFCDHENWPDIKEEIDNLEI